MVDREPLIASRHATKFGSTRSSAVAANIQDAERLEFRPSQATGAANRTRTCDPVITNDVLYQLSYCGGPNASLGQPPETPAPDIGHGPDWQEKRGLF